MAGYLQSILSLSLGAIGVDGGGRQTVIEQEIVNEVCSLLALDKYQSAAGRHRDQEIVESLLFGIAFDPDDLHGVSGTHMSSVNLLTCWVTFI
jgi:hypothetical protein